MTIRNCALLIFSALSLATAASAAESQFGFIYTTDLLPKDQKEIEQWLTLKAGKNGGSFALLEGRTAFEYGIADNFQGAFYVDYAWNHAYENGPFGVTTPAEQFGYDQPGPSDSYTATRLIGFSAEEIYRVLSPYTDPIGLALYLEPTIGDKFVELETRLILQKNFLDDTLVFAFNFTYAPEFRYLPPDQPDDPAGSSWKEETDLNMGLGGSYRFISNWSAGIEMQNEREFNSLGFVHESNSGYFIGPSIHYGGRGFFATAVLLRQLPVATTHEDTVPGAIVNGYDYDNDFEDFQFRVKLGYYL